jgi:hypothetical protein
MLCDPPFATLPETSFLRRKVASAQGPATSDRWLRPTPTGLGLKLALIGAVAQSWRSAVSANCRRSACCSPGSTTALAGISVALALSRPARRSGLRPTDYWHGIHGRWTPPRGSAISP